MDMRILAEHYRKNGFTPLPLTPNSKIPLAERSLYTADKRPVNPNNNIGLFAGSPNHLVIVDADNEQSRIEVTNRLRNMRLLDWVTVVRTPKRNGLHFWLRVLDVPEYAQAYYKLPSNIGGGEFRVRKPAYVVAPGSRIPEGEYTFVRGGIEQFNDQPAVKWADLVSWLVPKASPVVKKIDDFDKQFLSKIKYRPDPHVLKLLKTIDDADGAGRVQRIDYRTGEKINAWFDTRSEAEFSLVIGLALAGWSYDQIEELFEDCQPGHYAEVPNKQRYLLTTYNKAVSYVCGRGRKG